MMTIKMYRIALIRNAIEKKNQKWQSSFSVWLNLIAHGDNHHDWLVVLHMVSMHKGQK